MNLGVFDGGKLGLVDDAHVVDLTTLVGSGGVTDMLALVHRWDTLRPRLESADLAGLPRTPLAEAHLEAPLPRPGKILAAPVNYPCHQREMNVDLTVAELGIFLKANSSVIGPGETIELPYVDRRVDQEAELAVVIGRLARNVEPEAAMDHVFGYACLLDVTVRGGEDRSIRKSYDTFTPIGPWITTADAVPDPGALLLRCWINDELRQEVSTKDLIVGIPELVAFASSVMTLHPGDVIATGTPAGVGPLSDGDHIVVEIEQLGRLEVDVSAAGAVSWLDVQARLDVSDAAVRPAGGASA